MRRHTPDFQQDDLLWVRLNHKRSFNTLWGFSDCGVRQGEDGKFSLADDWDDAIMQKSNLIMIFLLKKMIKFRSVENIQIHNSEKNQKKMWVDNSCWYFVNYQGKRFRVGFRSTFCVRCIGRSRCFINSISRNRSAMFITMKYRLTFNVWKIWIF